MGRAVMLSTIARLCLEFGIRDLIGRGPPRRPRPELETPVPTRRQFLKAGTAAALCGAFPRPTPTHSAEARMPTARELLERGGTLIIGHRGLPGAAPENTLPSFEAALKHGPDFIELDYRHSADGLPMVIHDE